MTRATSILISLLISTVSTCSFAASNNKNDQYIVVYKPFGTHALKANEMPLESIETTLEHHYGVNIIKRFEGEFNASVIQASTQQIQQLRALDHIAYIELDNWLRVAPIQSKSVRSLTWGLDRIDQRNLPLDNAFIYHEVGQGVTAYVIDTGIAIEHQQFQGRAKHGWDFVDNDQVAEDCNGHGTHVAGTIGGNEYGVAKASSLVAVKVLDCQGQGRYSDVIAGMDWVKKHAVHPAVVNMSLGGGISRAIDEAANAMVQTGLHVVVAAGNENQFACNSSPARAEKVITVGASTIRDKRADFSNFGACVDLFSPGESITSAWIGERNSLNTISGTSMASPHVAGAIALLLEQNPNLTPFEAKAEIVRRSSKDKLTALNTGSPNYLLFSRDGETPDTDAPIPPLLPNVRVAVSAAQEEQLKFVLEAPAGQASLQIKLEGGNGDADLYVKHGSAPTLLDYDCRPFETGNNEQCQFSMPKSGRWFVLLNGYKGFSGAVLSATFADGSAPCDGLCLQNKVPVTGLSGGLNTDLHFTFDVPANKAVRVTMSGGEGDADLFVRMGRKPTTRRYDCRPFTSGNNEQCEVHSGEGGKMHILMRGNTRYSGISLVGQFD
ncbi:Alkaline serine exoprotease A precursor [Pseudoalteromonas luteoviolacea B = ATCC 29581]|nr:Alkaline serine exoprotease A precursor [Pseudoalteromonas luteoviolacea B = ATCC 29581]